MNISIPIIKILTVISTLILSIFLITNYMALNQNELQHKVVNAEIYEVRKIFKEILLNAYLTNQQQSIKIINLNKIKSNINKTNNIDFSIAMPNETLNWNISFTKICFISDCSVNINDLYSIGNNSIIKEYDFQIIPTLNVQINTTDFNRIRIYNFYITLLNFDSNYTLNEEMQIKFEIDKTMKQIIRVFESNFTIYFNLDNQNFLSYKIDEKSIIIFYLINIKCHIEPVRV